MKNKFMVNKHLVKELNRGTIIQSHFLCTSKMLSGFHKREGDIRAFQHHLLCPWFCKRWKEKKKFQIVQASMDAL
jgi:hypothetical protein